MCGCKVSSWWKYIISDHNIHDNEAMSYSSTSTFFSMRSWLQDSLGVLLNNQDSRTKKPQTILRIQEMC